MLRILQPGLRRGKLADRAGILLLLVLLLVLAVSVLTGVRKLAEG